MYVKSFRAHVRSDFLSYGVLCLLRVSKRYETIAEFLRIIPSIQSRLFIIERRLLYLSVASRNVLYNHHRPKWHQFKDETSSKTIQLNLNSCEQFKINYRFYEMEYNDEYLWIAFITILPKLSG
jgi:hypothetical protein